METGSNTGSRLQEGGRTQALYPEVLNTLAECVAVPCCRTVPDVAAAKVAQGPVKLMYDSQEHFEQITGQLKMLREWKDGESYPWGWPAAACRQLPVARGCTLICSSTRTQPSMQLNNQAA